MSIQLQEYRKVIETKSKQIDRTPDRQTKKLLLYLFSGTRGGFTRLKIIALLIERPYNTHQLAKKLELDYKAIQHHIKVLMKNNLITKVGDKYGAIFHLSNFLEFNIRALDDVFDKLEKKLNSKKVYL